MAYRSTSGRSPMSALLSLEQRHTGKSFKELRRQIIRGSPHAWQRFVERYSRTVYAFTLRLAGGGGESDEIAQQVYAQVFEKLAGDDFRLLRNFRGEARFETYLFTVIRNEVNRLRYSASQREGPLRSIEGEDDASGIQVRAGNTPEFIAEIGLAPQRVTDLVDQAMQRLDGRERLILRTRFLEGMPLRRLADVFGWKDTNAAAYEICKILRKLDLIGRCRRKFSWGEPEERVLKRYLGRWLAEAGAASEGDDKLKGSTT